MEETQRAQSHLIRAIEVILMYGDGILNNLAWPTNAKYQ